MSNALLPIGGDYASFVERSDRIAYLNRFFADYLQGRTLDVGCDQAFLKKLKPSLDYFGIDIGGQPDLRINLDMVDQLPFADRSFDTVICLDVLEHLDNFHRIFQELIRVSGDKIIVSLPNCWVGARRPLQRGHGAVGHYGLPIESPADRHRWFFNLSEARHFLERSAVSLGYRIVAMRVTEKPRPWPVCFARRLIYPKPEQYWNRYAHTLWAVLQRPG